MQTSCTNILPLIQPSGTVKNSEDGGGSSDEIKTSDAAPLTTDDRVYTLAYVV